MQRVFAAIFLILSIVAAIASLAPAVNWFGRWVLFHFASSLTDTVLCRINGDLTISSVSYSYTESLWKSCYSGECSNSAFLFLIPLVWKHSLISSRCAVQFSTSDYTNVHKGEHDGPFSCSFG